MTNFAKTLLAIIIVILIGLGYFFYHRSQTQTVIPVQEETAASSTNSISDGTITIMNLPSDFGLAVTPEQILVKSYIPACNPAFEYCLYYNGSEYEGTNFESAGIRIQKRTDIPTERLCLMTPPAGYDASLMPNATSTADSHSASIFANVGDAGAGHYATGSLYRLFIRSSSLCYEFETRIGQSQFANYPAGTIKEFTASSSSALQARLKTILYSIELPGGEKKLWN